MKDGGAGAGRIDDFVAIDGVGCDFNSLQSPRRDATKMHARF